MVIYTKTSFFRLLVYDNWKWDKLTSSFYIISRTKLIWKTEDGQRKRGKILHLLALTQLNSNQDLFITIIGIITLFFSEGVCKCQYYSFFVPGYWMNLDAQHLCLGQVVSDISHPIPIWDRISDLWNILIPQPRLKNSHRKRYSIEMQYKWVKKKIV